MKKPCPKGYMIFTTAIHDKARYDRYVEKAVPTVLQYSGGALVAYDGPEVIEGRWYGSRTVVLKFDSMEAARAWYHSPKCQAVVGKRRASAQANMAIVGGFEIPDVRPAQVEEAGSGAPRPPGRRRKAPQLGTLLS